MANEPMRYEVEDPQLQALLKDVGRRIKDQLPPEYGFTLMIFQFNGPNMFYLSSAERESMMQALREFLAKFGPN